MDYLQRTKIKWCKPEEIEAEFYQRKKSRVFSNRRNFSKIKSSQTSSLLQRRQQQRRLKI